ncbi:MAG: hypothetical protein ACR2FK_08510 [Sphingomicrobium sp.]
MIERRQVARLAWREYFPLLMTIAMWAVILAAIGHADTARLFAAMVMVRAIQMLTRLSTAPGIKLRVGAERAVRRAAKRLARTVQAIALCVAMVVLVALMWALGRIEQGSLAAFLPLIAIGMPARALRFTDIRTDSPYFRLALAGGGLTMASLGWAAGWQAVAMGLAFGAREWIAYAVIRFWPKAPHVPQRPVTDPLDWPEIARASVISARRLITYRMTKVALAVFGPLGNFAARTGRGLNWHSRIEPHLPHRLPGFILFAMVTAGGAAFLAIWSGEPAAMIGAAGLMQLACIATNIALMWRYLPDRDDPRLVVDEDDDE